MFLHGEVLNIFNVYQLCGCGGTVFTNGGGSDMRQINNSARSCRRSTPSPSRRSKDSNWRLGPIFGQATSRFAYTSPRTLRFNFGVRF